MQIFLNTIYSAHHVASLIANDVKISLFETKNNEKTTDLLNLPKWRLLENYLQLAHLARGNYQPSHKTCSLQVYDFIKGAREKLQTGS